MQTGFGQDTSTVIFGSISNKVKLGHFAVEAGHAGIMIEAPQSVVPVLETFILGNPQTDAAHLDQLWSTMNQKVLQNRVFAKEFMSSMGPGRVNFKDEADSDYSGKTVLHSKSSGCSDPATM